MKMIVGDNPRLHEHDCVNLRFARRLHQHDVLALWHAFMETGHLHQHYVLGHACMGDWALPPARFIWACLFWGRLQQIGFGEI